MIPFYSGFVVLIIDREPIMCQHILVASTPCWSRLWFQII